MKSNWNNAEAKKLKGDLLQLRVYTSNLLGNDEDLVMHGGGNTSVKIKETNIFGEEEEILYVKGSGWSLDTIKAEGFAPVKMTLSQPLSAPAPTTSQEAKERIRKGERWTAQQIRWVYVRRAEAIGAKNTAWEREGLSPKVRAQRAFAERKEARLVARAMMSDPREVTTLEARDRDKYGSPDGPTWEYLLAKGRAKGATKARRE